MFSTNTVTTVSVDCLAHNQCFVLGLNYEETQNCSMHLNELISKENRQIFQILMNECR